MAELLDGATIVVEQIAELLRGGGLHSDSLDRIGRLKSEGNWIDCLNSAQDLGLTMPHINHEMLIELLVKAWEFLAQIKSNYRRTCFKKVRMLEEDKKADPLVLDKWLKERSKADAEGASANISLLRVRQILAVLQEKEVLADVTAPQEAAPRQSLVKPVT